MKVVRKILKIVNLLAIFLVILTALATQWLRNTYGNISFDEILFTLTTPIKGTESSLINSFITSALLPSITYSILISIPLSLIYRFFFSSNFLVKIRLFKFKEHNYRLHGLVPFFLLLIINIGSLASILNACLDEVGIKDYYFNQTNSSNFIADHYIDPDSVKLSFPKEKRNLIHIYAESLESSYFSKELGGLEDKNLMEAITGITESNVYFSNSEKFGGAYVTTGGGYTSAGLASQMLALPVKTEKTTIGLDEHREHFLENAVGIGDILEENGYRRYFMMGSYKDFGNRDILLQEHGNYEIYDLTSAHRDGSLPEDYKVYWGFEDSKLFSFAKKQLTEIAKDDTPFNYSFLTENTHATEGYMEEDCPDNYHDQYTNVISCSASQIADFIHWLEKQDFYKDTTIVITGDHLSMTNNHFPEETYDQRRVYNLFINPAVKPTKTTNRNFTTLDIFPTTLAAMGVKIEGDRLGLGTNLFSDQKTLLEQYGFETLDTELAKRSIFYNDHFLLGKR